MNEVTDKDIDIRELVERLRTKHHFCYTNKETIFTEAADALERMQEINLAQSLQVAEKLDEFQKRIAELEGALREILTVEPGTGLECREIARAALQRKEKVE